MMFTGKVGYLTAPWIFLDPELGPAIWTGIPADADPDMRIFCGEEIKIGYYFTA
jgi:hypothetical protein